MSSAVLVAVAAALLCAPASIAGDRLGGLLLDGSALGQGPAPRFASVLRSWTAGPAVFGGLAGLLVAGPGGAVAGALVAVSARRRQVRRRASIAAAGAAEQLADALGRIVDELRVGSHPAAALGGVDADGPRAAELLAPAAVAARLGDGVPAALRRTAAGRGDVGVDLQRIAAAWGLAEQHGIPLADLLADAQSDIRWRVRFGNSVRAELAGPRATATVLTALPALGLGLGQLLGADPLAILRGGVLGQALLVLGVALVVAGSAWTEHILRKAMPR